MRVIIIGAGIGGLCTAVGLQRAGVDVTVLERAERLRPAGSGLSLFANAATALGSIGLGGVLDALSAPGAAGLRGGQRRPDGSWLAIYPREAIASLRVVHRADLHERLVTELHPGTVRLGAEAAVVDQAAASVTTRGGDVLHADVVVAADGIRSSVRSAWPGDPGVRYSGYSTWRGVTARPVDLEGAAGETWGRGERFGLAPLADGRVYWFAVASMREDACIENEFAEVRARFAHWHSPIPALLDATEPAGVFRLPIHDLAAPLRTFRSGRCVLLGDAAHAMTPDLGQGAGQAIEDAATLTALLRPLASASASSSDAVEDALARYDRLRRRRTQPLARRARMLGQVAQVRSAAGVALRDAVLRATPASALGRQLRAVQQWKLPDSV
jgi:2-polyprenyl-6-methoxyphenol hydroxylase-like FAD-dependent oxidoreductase